MTYTYQQYDLTTKIQTLEIQVLEDSILNSIEPLLPMAREALEARKRLVVKYRNFRDYGLTDRPL